MSTSYKSYEDEGLDAMYAYRYLNWHLNSPPYRGQRLFQGPEAVAQTVLNLLGRILVEQFGAGIPEENEDDMAATVFAAHERASQQDGG